MMHAFDSDVLRAIEIARWAPSSHNSQPWRAIHIADRRRRPILSGLPESSNVVVVLLDHTRMLKALPSLQVEMYLSCGMFLGLMVAALEAQGHACSLRWLCEEPWADETETLEADFVGQALVAVAAHGEGKADEVAALERLGSLAAARRTYRAPFLDRPVAEADAVELFAARWSPELTGDGSSVRPEYASQRIQRAGELVARYGALDFSDRAAWSETYRYIHFNPDEPAEDGFYLASLVGPVSRMRRRLMQIVLAPAVMQALRVVGLPKRMGRELGALVAKSPGLLMCRLPGHQPEPKALLQAGARLMEVWLNAQRLNVAIHPVSVVLQHDEPRRELERLCAVSGRAVFFARFGYADTARPFEPTPRRPVENVLRAA